MPEIFLFFLFFCFLLFILLKLLFSVKNREKTEKKIELSELSVLIPFRNETENLKKLISSLKKQTKFPAEIIFIDDYSEDNSIQIIEKELPELKNAQLLKLSDNLSGKKQALNFGVAQAKSVWILTLDADVELGNQYFSTLEKQMAADLISLPVITKGKGFWSSFFACEYLFFNAFNFLVSPVYPISVSGANLLFHKEKSDYEHQLKTHQNLFSGDDYFLLKYFRKKKRKIIFSNQKELAVTTNSPDNFRAYFSQRVRWLGKSKHQFTLGEFLVSGFIFLYFALGFFTFFYLLFTGAWKILIAVFFLRLFLDAALFLNYSQRLEEGKYALFLPLFQFLYPILLTIVFVQSLYRKPKWKERG